MDASIRAALAPFGATLTEQGFIAKGDKITGVKVVGGRRLRFETAEGTLLASGKPCAATVVQFVRKFWFWEAL